MKVAFNSPKIKPLIVYSSTTLSKSSPIRSKDPTKKSTVHPSWPGLFSFPKIFRVFLSSYKFIGLLIEVASSGSKIIG